ncbi:MAG: helix-turn-helix transcriptional regulator [Firmicutes bacterium]|nr:helix-turn-helix transcriptional regulator [Bacillota bacterium]
MDIKRTGLIIKEARENKGYTQKELADRLNVSDRAVSKWERGAGFPDVTLLEALSDELGITMQCLISGKQDSAEAAKDDEAVRNAVKFVYRQTIQKVRRNIVSLVAGLICLIMSVFVMYAVLDYSGAFLENISQEVMADIYENGKVTGETKIYMEGTYKDGRNKSFWGKFHVEVLPVTADEKLTASIKWDKGSMNGFPQIYYYRDGMNLVETGIKQKLYISDNMKNFAFELEDGRIIATSEALAVLEGMEGWRYDINYNFYYGE